MCDGTSPFGRIHPNLQAALMDSTSSISTAPSACMLSEVLVYTITYLDRMCWWPGLVFVQNQDEICILSNIL